jgi:hypothetical protein
MSIAAFRCISFRSGSAKSFHDGRNKSGVALRYVFQIKMLKEQIAQANA